MRIYLLSVIRVANANILPFNWRATTAEFKATIAQYEKQGKGLFDLSPSMAAAQELDDALARFHDALAKGKPGRLTRPTRFSFALPAFSFRSTTPRSALPA